MSIREFKEKEVEAVNKFGEILLKDSPNLTKGAAVAMAKIMANTKGRELAPDMKNANLKQRITDSVAPSNVSGDVAGYDPVLLGVLSQSAHKMLALDVVGIQPMNQSRGQIFSLRRWYDKPSSGFPFAPQSIASPLNQGSGVDQAATTDKVDITAPVAKQPHNPTLETDVVNQMSISIEALGVEAKERKIKSILSKEFVEDLDAYHGLNGRTLTSSLLTDEIAMSTDRQILASMYSASTPFGTGTYNIVSSGDGRWLEERAKSLAYHIMKMSNGIGDATFKGLGNVAIVSFGVAQALNLSGLLSGVAGEVDWLRSTYIGMLGHIQVFVDPYLEQDAVAMTYKYNDVDASMYYAPYVSLDLYDGMQEDSGNDVIFARSRYATALNPLGTANGANPKSTYITHSIIEGL